MPALTSDQRVEFVRTLWDTFREQFKVRRDCMTQAEYHLAYGWAKRGVPLAVILQGIVETTGEPRTLMACERAVDENIGRWLKAVCGLTELPEPGPLEDL